MKLSFRKMVLALACGAFCLSSCVETEQVDVLIIGGGASGISAGIQCARMGVPAMIVEETPWVGGMLTAAGVSCVDGNYNLQSGIFGEFADSLAHRYGGWEALKTGWVSNINFEPQVGQEILTNMAAGCEKLEIRRETVMLDVAKQEDKWIVLFKAGNSRSKRMCL